MGKSLKKDPLNIVICGVGGQGNILATELLGSALVEKGFLTTVGETYGASQRGGAVMSHVRVSMITEYGVLIPEGEADIIIGFEPIETLRVARMFANKHTRVVFDPRPNYPLAVLIGEAIYPDIADIEKELKKLCGEVRALPATDLAVEAGNSQAANIILMGALTAIADVPIKSSDYDEVLSQRFRGKVLELNRQVFHIGYDEIAE